MRKQLCLGLLSLAVFISPATAGTEAKPLPESVKKAHDQVRKYVDDRGGQMGQIIWVEEKALKQVFPDLLFFAVRFRQYPVAFAPPEGMSSSNVVVVGDKLTLLPDQLAFNKFFSAQWQTRKPPTADQAKAAAVSYLALNQELVQDGFYTFEIIQAGAENKNGNMEATGRSMVTKGGNGDIRIELQFMGQNLIVNHNQTIRPGPRPKCQATRLIDNDPLIRHMAETELRFMGLAARSYLLEQRDKADNPRLRQAIQQLLEKMEADGW
jgi:hypothetical protein